MEIKGGYTNKKHILFSEFLGTAILLIAINHSSTFGGHQPLAVGMSLFCIIVIFGGISGGHFNPAVSIGVLIAEGTSNI